MNLGPHAAFIIASYSAGLLVVAGLIAWVAADYARQLRALGELEKQGITRRSRGPAENDR